MAPNNYGQYAPFTHGLGAGAGERPRTTRRMSCRCRFTDVAHTRWSDAFSRGRPRRSDGVVPALSLHSEVPDGQEDGGGAEQSPIDVDASPRAARLSHAAAAARLDASSRRRENDVVAAKAGPSSARDGGTTSGRSAPAVAGVAGGVGTTTIAAAIGGIDRGLFIGRAIDLLVCRATGDSLIRAGHAAALVGQLTGRRPVVAVTAADGAGPSRPVTARLRLLAPNAAAVVVLPYVRRWRELAAPLDEARVLLTVPSTDLPRALRRYAGAAQDLLTSLSGLPAPARPLTNRVAARPTMRRTR